MEDIVIIGAGLAGLACARRLRAAGLAPVVLDKGRGLGGRLATRRAQDGAQFDHGAQFVTARTVGFRDALAQAQAAGQADVWIDAADGSKYVGQPGMSGLAKCLAEGLDVRRATQVTEMVQEDAGWRLETSEGPITARHVVSTVPAPQACNLLGADHPLTAEVGKATYHPCLALMVSLVAPAPVRGPTVRQEGDPLAWIARDSDKPGRPDVECWVAHASTEWSAEHLELDKEEIADRMLPLFLAHVGAAPEQVRYVAGHRWRYARVDVPLGRSFAKSDDGTFYAGGDWCLGPRAEAAWTSGTEIAEDILGARGAGAPEMVR